MLTENGASHVPLRDADHQIANILDVTHIVTTSIDFPQYHAALENGVAIVKPSWVLSSVNRRRTAATRQHNPDPSQYMQDVVVTTAGLPEGDMETIIAGVIALGGMHSPPLSKLVTHIVALNTDNDKCRAAKQNELSCYIVLPHWFDDCFRLGRKIHEDPYSLPGVEILQKTDHKIRDVAVPQIVGAISATPCGGPPITPLSSPTPSRKELNVFSGRTVMLSKDLDLPNHLRRTLETCIDSAGGEITNTVKTADVLIAQYRDGPDYVKASRARKEVGNLSWLYHVINRNKYTSPLGKLLHYPVPRDGIAGFEHMRISVSNYSGEARLYLENLIRCTGAEFTKTMRQDNTHLITAHKYSEKCEAAQEWNMNVVNHIWLEESYAKCAAQSLTNERYTHFPARTNLAEVVGHTRFDLQKLERQYFSEAHECPRKAVPTTSTPTLQNESSSGADADALGDLTPLNWHDATEDAMSVEAPDGPQLNGIKSKKGRGRPKSAALTPRPRPDNKENKWPSVTSIGRASKTKAIGLLHNQADDIAQFQKELKRKGGVTHGGRRSSLGNELHPVDSGPTQRRKRKSDEASYDATDMGSNLSDGETQPVKASKKTKKDAATPGLPPVQYKMMVTGDERWLNNPNKESSDSMILRRLGVKLTQDAKEVDILIAPKILRTPKFVCALAGAPMVFHTDYLDAALEQRRLVDNPATLQDRDAEERLGFKLEEALERAQVNDRKLFRGWSIFVTNDVSPGFETYKEIIQLNGGDAFLYRGRLGVTMSSGRVRNDPAAGNESQHQGDDDEFEYVYLVSGTSATEMRLWKTFREGAKKQNLTARIVRKDWLLSAAMSQQIKWDDKLALSEKTG